MIYLLLLLLSLSIPAAHAAVINASSCNTSAVQAAFNAASNGDTINVPAGTCTYSSRAIATNKSLKVIGAGKGVTTLRVIGSNHATFEFQCNSVVDGIEVTGFTFDDESGSRSSDNVGVKLQNNCRNFKIHGNIMRDFSRAGVQVFGFLAYGVVYQNDFLDNYDNSNSTGYGVECVGGGNASWSRWPSNPNQLPAEDVEMIYVEDNFFRDNKHELTMNNGCRGVGRFNDSVMNRQNTGNWDAHGLGSWPRGTRQSHYYNNTQSTSAGAFSAHHIRGGDGLIYNETQTGPFTNLTILQNETSGSRSQGSNCGYPCTDQIRKHHSWNNRQNGSLRNPTVPSNYNNLIQLGRDYFTTGPPAGYVAFPYPHPLRGASPPIIASTFSAGYVLRSQLSRIYIDLDDPNGGISANPATGFTCRVNTIPVTLSNVSCASQGGGRALCQMDHTGVVDESTDTITCSYDQALGNVLDGADPPLELLAFTDAALINFYDQVLNDRVVSNASTTDSGRPVSALFDGDTTNESRSMVVSNSTSMFVEFDLRSAISLNAAIVFGDATFSKQCLTYNFASKQLATDPFVNVLTGVNCNNNISITSPFTSTNARFWRFDFTGPAAGTQVFEANARVDTTSGGGGLIDNPAALQAALDAASPGDVIEIQNGTYTNTWGQIDIDIVNGTQTQPITLKCVTTRGCIFEGGGVDRLRFNIRKNWWVIDGLVINNMAAPALLGTYDVQGAQNLVLKNLQMSANNTGAKPLIFIDSVPGGQQASNITIIDINVLSHTGQVIDFTCANDVFSSPGCPTGIKLLSGIFNNVTYTSASTACFQVGSQRLNSLHDFMMLVDGNVLVNTDCDFDTWHVQGSGVTFSGNNYTNTTGHTIRQSQGTILDGNLFKVEGTGVTYSLRLFGPDHQVINNIFTNDNGGTSAVSGVTLPNGSGTGATHMTSASPLTEFTAASNALIANNTFYNFPTRAIWLRADLGGGLTSPDLTSIRNNIIWCDTGTAIQNSGSTNETVTHQLFNLNGSCVVGLRGDNSVAGDPDPSFVNLGVDFHLNADSPAINTGVNLAQVTTDFDGNARAVTSTTDIGAYEFQGVPTPPANPTVTFTGITLFGIKLFP